MRKIILFLSAIFILIALSACQKAEISTTENLKTEKLAIKGYDTVSYFIDGAAKGNPQYSFVWNGAKWLFSTSENLEKFKQNPEKYIPQFDGQCSYSVAQGSTAEGDPDAWKVVDGKLYLNFSESVKKRWEADQDNLIREGEKKWMELKDKKTGS
jgi:YHS domain-containing protein